MNLLRALFNGRQVSPENDSELVFAKSTTDSKENLAPITFSAPCGVLSQTSEKSAIHRLHCAQSTLIPTFSQTDIVRRPQLRDACSIPLRPHRQQSGGR